MKNSGWKLETIERLDLVEAGLALLGILGGGSRGLGGLILSSVIESAALRGLGAGALNLPDLPRFLSSSSSLFSAVSDLALWMLSTVGGVMCLDWAALCLVNIFLAGGGDLSGVES